MFVKATKTKSKARICLMGPSGSGKTFTALSIAKGLGKSVALIDTEHGSAAKYSDVFEFDTCELRSFTPKNYVQAINAAHEYDVLIIDSLSHEWAGRGGCLEIVNRISDDSSSKNSYAAWGKVTPQHNDFLDAILAVPCHLIATMRVKMGYSMETNDKGKMTPVKVGLEPVQRDGVEFEFDIVASLDQNHVLRISKTRYAALDEGIFEKPGKELGDEIAKWLNVGSDPAPLCSKEDVEDLVTFADGFGVDKENLKDLIFHEFPQVTQANFMKAFTLSMAARVREIIVMTAPTEKLLETTNA